MSAHGDDLRYYYAEHFGPTQVTAASAVSSALTERLTPGRYLLQFNTVAGGATLVWVKQGAFGSVAATAAAPSMPIDLTENPKPRFFFMVRPGIEADGLAFITNAGTVNAVVTKVSRDAQ